MRYTILFFILLMLFSSCEEPKKEEEKIETVLIFPRISIVSQNTNIADVTVEIEGYDGNLVSGAVVLVSNNSNGILKCNYDFYTGSYFCKYPIPANGIINVSIDSILSSYTLNYTIPHRQIVSKPVINVFEDSDGCSVLMGMPVDFLRTVQIGWTSSGEGIVYQITIRSALQTLYQASTESLTHIIPGGIVDVSPGQIYYIQINAQRIIGDPFFKTSRIYSAAIRTGDTISFNVW